MKGDKRRVAWGITGSGDRIAETVTVMKDINHQYGGDPAIRVFLSKAGLQVAKYYNLLDELKDTFGPIQVEIDSNTPFLAGALQLRRFDFLLIAPATSNTVAKISLGIADTLLCNAAIMALKAFNPVYVMPSDYEEGTTVTTLPGGRDLKIRIRKEDVLHVRKLTEMEGVSVLESPEAIPCVFKRHFGVAGTQKH